MGTNSNYKLIAYVAIVIAVISVAASLVYVQMSFSGRSAGNVNYTVSTTSIPYRITSNSSQNQYSTAPANNYRVTTNLVTWNDTNGYYNLHWNEISELDIFHVVINPNGSLSYDGELQGPNVSDVISAAHSNGVIVLLAVGGEGENQAIINNTIGNSSMRSKVVGNIVNEVVSNNYNGVQVDLEGYFSKNQFTAFVELLSEQLRARNSNYIIDVDVADYEQQDFNIPALAPYVNTFNLDFNPSLQDLQSWANQAGGHSKMAAGYDLTDIDNFTGLQQNLANDTSNGYGIFFFNAAEMNSTVWNAIAYAEGQG